MTKEFFFKKLIARQKLTGIVIILFIGFYSTTVYGALAGGRPNAFSEGNNAFAGVVNPANAVWIPDRLDVGAFWVNQKSSINNTDNNPIFPPGRTYFTYKSRNILTTDFAIQRHFNLKIGPQTYDSSLTLATYTMPEHTRLRTKYPLPSSGTTPVINRNKINVVSAVFSFKLNDSHSFGLSIDGYYFSHLRNGFQNSDNPVRSVSPGNVTNNGYDHSSGVGCSIGWRWNISKRLKFGMAWIKKTYCGQYKKYQGYEPHHAKNYIPHTVGAGFSYAFTKRLLGRVDVLWFNFGGLPGANNNILSDGSLNLNKRGANNSPGPGLQDATFINVGLGYKFNSILSLGSGFSHRIRRNKGSNFISHTYQLQTIYDLLSIGANFKYKKNDVYLVFSYGFKNKTNGLMPLQLGGGRFSGEKQTTSLSISWGYLY
jgi:long-chain fatty acid transport protein